jgi:hypothetical protein
MFHLEERFRHAEQLPGSKAESARKEERDIHSTPVACNPFPFCSQFAARAGESPQLSRAAIHWPCNSIATDLGDTMTYDSHQRAAEFHMLAAHAHQAAAAHHGKEDHLTAHEQSRQAMEYASKAFEFSKQAHDESSVIFRKHEKKA